MNFIEYNSDKRLKTSSLVVTYKRRGMTESIHRVHAVVSDNKGRVLMSAGDTKYETFIRSALKPFQALPFISSGALEKIDCGPNGLAISCASHCGSNEHAREAFKILWNSDIDINLLKCPIPSGKISPLQHNCSGKHAAFLATCKKMGWPLESYLHIKHPLQVEIQRRIGDILGLPGEELVTARDNCGAQTISLQLDKISFLYAYLSSSAQAEFEKITRVMVSNPNLIGGPGRFDTELMNRAHGQVLSKGGAEGVQCLSRVGEGIGIAIKSEDGASRAKHAVAIHLLAQLEWITPTGLEELKSTLIKLPTDVTLEVQGNISFQEN